MYCPCRENSTVSSRLRWPGRARTSCQLESVTSRRPPPSRRSASCTGRNRGPAWDCQPDWLSSSEAARTSGSSSRARSSGS